MLGKNSSVWSKFYWIELRERKKKYFLVKNCVLFFWGDWWTELKEIIVRQAHKKQHCNPSFKLSSLFLPSIDVRHSKHNSKKHNVRFSRLTTVGSDSIHSMSEKHSLIVYKLFATNLVVKLLFGYAHSEVNFCDFDFLRTGRRGNARADWSDRLDAVNVRALEKCV